MTNHTKELLTKNKKALQFLHIAHGFDFEAEHIVKAIEGRFTYNSVIKEIEKDIPAEYTAAVLVDPINSYIFPYLHYASISKGKFHPLRVKGLPHWEFNIHEFFSIGSFEEMRKNSTKRVYIIAQKTELLIPPNTNKGINLSQRFRYVPSDYEKCGDGRGNTYINKIKLMRLDGSAEIFEYMPNNTFYPGDKKPKTIEEVIDKSGYLIINRRRELKAAAKRLKADRERAAALAADFTEEERKTRDGIAAAKKYITDAITAANSWESGRKAAQAASELGFLLNDFENLHTRSFPSIAAKQDHFKRMAERIQTILNGGKEA